MVREQVTLVIVARAIPMILTVKYSNRTITLLTLLTVITILQDYITYTSYEGLFIMLYHLIVFY